MKKKNISTMVSILVIVFTAQISLTAATCHWEGGTGYWHDPDKWSCNMVPTANDDVIIQHGTVLISNGISATAKSVLTEAKLTIYNGGNLTIDGPDEDGLVNHGRMNIYGELIISNISGSFDNGFTNYGKSIVYSSGRITVGYASGYSIFNEDKGVFSNKGYILMTYVQNGLRNQNYFKNTGQIHYLNNQNDGTAFYNEKTFVNEFGGSLRSEGTESYAVLNYDNGQFQNKGKIIMRTGTYYGLNNTGNFTNYSTGTMSATQFSSYGFYNGGEFTNNGTCVSQTNDKGLYNDGHVINNHYFNCSINISAGIHSKKYTNGITPTIENNGYWYIDGNDAIAIKLEYAELTNSDEGEMYSVGFIEGKILFNHGIFHSYYSGNHDIAFINEGAVADVYNAFGGNIDNNRLLVQPSSEAFLQGVPINNILEVSSLSNISIGDWTVTGVGVAGSYNVGSNTFTANSTGHNQTVLYIETTIISSGLTRNLEIRSDVAQPIIAHNNSYEVEHTNDDQWALQNTQQAQFTIFPNPTTESFQIRNIFNVQQVAIYDWKGVLVRQVFFDDSIEEYRVQLPNNLMDGSYIVRIEDTTGNVQSQQLIVQK